MRLTTKRQARSQWAAKTMPLLQQESKEQSRMPTGGGKPPTDSEAVNLRKGLFVGPNPMCKPCQTHEGASEARDYQSSWAMFRAAYFSFWDP